MYLGYVQFCSVVTVQSVLSIYTWVNNMSRRRIQRMQGVFKEGGLRVQTPLPKL